MPAMEERTCSNGDPLPRIVTDRHGARLRLRPIRPADWHEVQEGYETWTPQQKRMRMLDTVAHLTEGMARRFATVGDEEHEVCLVLTPEEDDADLLGGARLVGRAGAEDGEFAVSVRADAQGRGLGRIALEAVLDAGPSHGITRAWGLVHRRNAGMLGLARALGMAVRPFPDDITLLVSETPLPRPTA